MLQSALLAVFDPVMKFSILHVTIIQGYYKESLVMYILKASMVECWIINTLNRYPQLKLNQFLLDSPSTPQLALARHSINISIKSRPNFQLIHISWPTLSRLLTNSVDEVFIKCRLNINRTLIEMSIKFTDWEYWLTCEGAFSMHDPEMFDLPDSAITAMSSPEGGGCLHMVNTLFMSSNPLPIIPLGVCAKSKQCPSSCIEAPRPVA